MSANENGATGSRHMSSLAYEAGPFGQRHKLGLHGSGGTLRAISDRLTILRVEDCHTDDTIPHEMPIPDRIWAGPRRDTIHDVYRDVVRQQENMTRGFVIAIANGEPASPDFRDGLAVQRVLGASDRSASEGRRVTIQEIAAGGG